MPLVNVAAGGTEFRAFGQDVLTPENQIPKSKIPFTLFWSALRINVPIVVGVLLGLLRLVKSNWTWCIVFLPWAACLIAFAVSKEAFWGHYCRVAFIAPLAFAITLPCTTAKEKRGFAIGCACAMTWMWSITEFATDGRFIDRSLQKLVYGGLQVFSIPTDKYAVATWGETAELVLIPIAGVAIGWFVQLWYAKVNAEAKESPDLDEQVA